LTKFAKGQSGNPSGKPVGTRWRSTELVEGIMREGGESVARAIVVAAQGGYMTAAKVVIDRLAPAPRGRFLQIIAPKIEKPADALPLMAVLDTMAKGTHAARGERLEQRRPNLSQGAGDRRRRRRAQGNGGRAPG
jgi:hypothetical protein